MADRSPNAVTVIVLAFLLSLVVACDGSIQSGTDQAGPAVADPKAMGVDMVDWPVDVPAGYALLQGLPKQLAGRQLSVHRPANGFTAADYGRGDQAATISVMGTTKTLKDPQSALSFLFGMVYSCDKSTYAGTARSDDGGYTPALGNGDSGEEPVWFSCDVDGAEGSPKFTGQAVGWTSGETAWLAMSGDGRMMNSMMRALVGAR